MQDITKYLTWMENLPGLALVALACLVIGYVFKLIPKFPNQVIPLVIILCAMVLTPLVDEGKPADQTMRMWLVRHLIYGMAVGAATWFFHAQILKRFEDKIPILGAFLSQPKTGSESEPNEGTKTTTTTGP